MTTIPSDDSIQNLVQRIELALTTDTGRIIAFISARSDEGTSTIARDYAQNLAEQPGQKILLIDAGKIDGDFYRAHSANPKVNIADTVAAGKPLTEALFPVGPHVMASRWAGVTRGQSSKIIKDQEFWHDLRAAYTTTVIDAPSLSESPEGIALAASADAVIMVVEAETTRQPVAENLRDQLKASGAHVLGVVMNKRRYYIPDSVYQKM